MLYGNMERTRDIPGDALSRLERLVGAESLTRLGEATVAVFGLGGVGAACAETLARSGIGTLVIIDCDVVQESNINRQSLAFRSTIGQRKVDVMERMLADINPDCRVIPHDAFALPENLATFLDPRPNFIVDCLDTIVTELAIAAYGEQHGIPTASAMGAGNKFDPCRLRFADIYDTKVCPLCKVVRKEARKRGIGHMRVLYSPEPPTDHGVSPGAARAERTNIGTMSYMPPIMGMMLASDAIRCILGLPRS